MPFSFGVSEATDYRIEATAIDLASTHVEGIHHDVRPVGIHHLDHQRVRAVG
jgi:hypothetical protein